MNYPNIPQYRFDLSGSAQANFIPSELVERDVTKGYVVCVPRHAPFYIDSLKLTFINGQPLTYGTDYELFSIMGELSAYTGKGVGCFIRILNKNITSFNASYQTVGSLSLFDQSLANMLDMAQDDNRAIWYDDILNKPDKFTPEWHFHDVAYDIYGFKDMATALSNLLNNPNDVAPHGPYFEQRILNALKYIAGYVAQYKDLLNAHIANQFNAHGLTGKDIGLGLRDNFAVLTADDDITGKKVNNKHLVTPAWFANLAQNTQGQSERYVQRNALPISRYGDNTYIPPNLDSDVYGAGCRHSFGVACLEQGGWYSVLQNHYDFRAERLMYLKIIPPFDNNQAVDKFGGLVTQSKMQYRPARAVSDGVIMNSVFRGGDGNWFIAGNRQSNKWYLVKANGTLNASAHTLYPITFPYTLDPEKIESLSMTYTDTNVYIFDDSLRNSFDYNVSTLSLASLSLSTANAFTYLSIQSVDQNGVGTVKPNGLWSMFPYVTNADGKLTQWFTKLTTPITQGLVTRTPSLFMKKDAAGNIFLRVYAITSLMYLDNEILFPISVVFQLTSDGSGNLKPTVIKGNPNKALDLNIWDTTSPSAYPNHVNDTVNLPFMDEFLDSFPGTANGLGHQCGASMLSDGRIFAMGSSHWSFYPLQFQVPDKGWFDFSDINNFKTGRSPYTVSNLPITQYPLGNISPSGVSPNLGHYSVHTPTSGGTGYELVRSEVLLGEFQTIARGVTTDKTTNITAPNGNTYLGAAFTSDLRTTDIPDTAYRVHWCDENLNGNSQTFFSLASGTTKGLSVGIDNHVLTYDYVSDHLADNTKLTFTETSRLIFTQTVIKELVAQFNPGAVYSGKQCNWNIVWFPGKEGIAKPLMIVSWIDKTDLNNPVMRSGIGVLTYNLDPSVSTNFTVNPVSGIREITYGSLSLKANNIVSGFVAALPKGTDYDMFRDAPPSHVQPGSVTLYRTLAGRISVFVNTTQYLSITRPTTAGNSKVPDIYFEYSGGNTVVNARYSWTNWDATSNVFNAVKSVGMIASFNQTTSSLIGGCIIAGQYAGTTYDDILSVLADNSKLGQWYMVTDINQLAPFTLFFSAVPRLVVDGGQYSLAGKYIPLSTIKASPGNTTYYVYVEMVEGIPDYSVKLAPSAESSRRMLIAVVTTNATGISNIQSSPVFTLNGKRISTVPIGSAIPATSGSVLTAGINAWANT